MKYLSYILFLFTPLHAYSTIYGVLAGISEYEDSYSNLRYADRDAEAMCKLFSNYNNADLKNISLLTNDQATKENIIKALNTQFSKAKKNDVVLFYYSGHGSGRYFTTCHSGQNLYHSEIKAAFKRSKAGIKLCIACACHSGNIKQKETNNTPASWNRHFNKTNIIVFISCRQDETAYEYSSLGHSVFTYYLLNAFQGKADLNRDGKISIKELFDYVSYQVRIYTNERQNPVMFGQFNENAIMLNLK